MYCIHHQIWAPPTPPQDENDVYIDHTMGLLYDSSSMMESELPPVYIKKEPKKIKVDHGKFYLIYMFCSYKTT